MNVGFIIFCLFLILVFATLTLKFRKSRIVKFRKPKINPTIIEPVDDIFKDQGFDSITSRVPILPKEKVKKIPVSKVKTVNKKSKVVAKKTPRNKTKKK